MLSKGSWILIQQNWDSWALIWPSGTLVMLPMWCRSLLFYRTVSAATSKNTCIFLYLQFSGDSLQTWCMCKNSVVPRAVKTSEWRPGSPDKKSLGKARDQAAAWQSQICLFQLHNLVLYLFVPNLYQHRDSGRLLKACTNRVRINIQRNWGRRKINERREIKR